MSGIPIAELVAKVKAQRAREEARIAELCGDDAPVRLDAKRGAATYLVHPSCGAGGGWRVTAFEGDEPTGHMLAASKGDALRRALEMGARLVG